MQVIGVNGFCLLKTLVPQAKLDTKNIFGCKILSALSFGWESFLMIQKYTYSILQNCSLQGGHVSHFY
jgi:hypothetical protein